MPQFAKSVLVDHEIHLPETTHRSFEWLGSTWEFPTFENVDMFVNRLVHAEILAFDPVVEDALGGQTPHFSPRSLQRRFLHVTGLTQKTIQQIERARQAAGLLLHGAPITETALQTGFFDQAHLTNSLRRFYGQTPVQIASGAQVHSGAFFQDGSAK